MHLRPQVQASTITEWTNFCPVPCDPTTTYPASRIRVGFQPLFILLHKSPYTATAWSVLSSILGLNKSWWGLHCGILDWTSSILYAKWETHTRTASLRIWQSTENSPRLRARIKGLVFQCYPNDDDMLQVLLQGLQRIHLSMSLHCRLSQIDTIALCSPSKSGPQLCRKTENQNINNRGRITRIKPHNPDLWWKRLFSSTELDPEEASDEPIRCDNKQTVQALQKDHPVFKTHLRHVDIQNHWLWQEVQQRHIRVCWIPTSSRWAQSSLSRPPNQLFNDR